MGCFHRVLVILESSYPRTECFLIYFLFCCHSSSSLHLQISAGHLLQSVFMQSKHCRAPSGRRFSVCSPQHLHHPPLTSPSNVATVFMDILSWPHWLPPVR